MGGGPGVLLRERRGRLPQPGLPGVGVGQESVRGDGVEHDEAQRDDHEGDDVQPGELGGAERRRYLQNTKGPEGGKLLSRTFILFNRRSKWQTDFFYFFFLL